MENKFKRIGLIGRHRATGAIETLNVLENFLKKNKIDYTIEKSTAEAMGFNVPEQTVQSEELGGCSDLIIVVGGDGSLLHAAHAVVSDEVPVLGINRGRLGFLTDIHPSRVEEEVGAVLSGEFDEESRFLLEADVIRDDKVVNQCSALNEVVMYAGDVARMIEFEVYISGKFVYSQRSDGLIAATPTGSTAYALSGGGPILHPSLEAIVLVPMFPHTLTSRPIVIDSNESIELVVPSALEIYPGVSADGQAPILLSAGDKVRIKKKDKRLRLIHPKDHNFYQVLRSKLQWGTQWETSL